MYAIGVLVDHARVCTYCIHDTKYLNEHCIHVKHDNFLHGSLAASLP